jgi:hypothetical protein
MFYDVSVTVNPSIRKPVKRSIGMTANVIGAHKQVSSVVTCTLVYLSASGNLCGMNEALRKVYGNTEVCGLVVITQMDIRVTVEKDPRIPKKNVRITQHLGLLDRPSEQMVLDLQFKQEPLPENLKQIDLFLRQNGIDEDPLSMVYHIPTVWSKPLFVDPDYDVPIQMIS